MQAGLTETCTYGAWPSAEDARGLLFFRYCDVIILAEMHTFVPLPALPYPWLQVVHSADPGYSSRRASSSLTPQERNACARERTIVGKIRVRMARHVLKECMSASEVEERKKVA